MHINMSLAQKTDVNAFYDADDAAHISQEEILVHRRNRPAYPAQITAITESSGQLLQASGSGVPGTGVYRMVAEKPQPRPSAIPAQASTQQGRVTQRVELRSPDSAANPLSSHLRYASQQAWMGSENHIDPPASVDGNIFEYE